MVDANYIKSILTIDDVISIMSELGADYNFASSSEVHFRSICHNSDSYKLYYYDGSKSFFCHRCSEHYDIFGIVEKIKEIDFIDAVSFVCTLCRIEQTYQKVNTQIDDWQKDLKKFLPNYEPNEPLRIYDNEVIDLFINKYHQSWIDDGISKSAMDKFGIKFYERNAQIVIPVHDINGSLVGIHARNTRQKLVDKGLKYQPVKTLNEEYKFQTSGVLYGLYENLDNIKSTKSAIICEAPKGCLQAENILDYNTTVALFGWNMQSRRRDILLNLGVEDITIALDRQYKEQSEDEFSVWVKQVKKIAKLFKPYCNVYTIWDKENLLGYKDSPFDRGKDVFDKLYSERVKL